MGTCNHGPLALVLVEVVAVGCVDGVVVRVTATGSLPGTAADAAAEKRPAGYDSCDKDG